MYPSGPARMNNRRGTCVLLDTASICIATMLEMSIENLQLPGRWVSGNARGSPLSTDDTIHGEKVMASEFSGDGPCLHGCEGTL